MGHRVRRLLFTAGLGLLLCAAWGATTSPDQVGAPFEDHIVICSDVVPAELVEATFVVAGRLNLDGRGRVTSVKEGSGFGHVSRKALLGCLGRWRLPSADQEATFVLQWEHGRGWSSLTVSLSGQVPRRITLEPGCRD